MFKKILFYNILALVDFFLLLFFYYSSLRESVSIESYTYLLLLATFIFLTTILIVAKKVDLFSFSQKTTLFIFNYLSYIPLIFFLSPIYNALPDIGLGGVIFSFVPALIIFSSLIIVFIVDLKRYQDSNLAFMMVLAIIPLVFLFVFGSILATLKFLFKFNGSWPPFLVDISMAFFLGGIIAMIIGSILKFLFSPRKNYK